MPAVLRLLPRLFLPPIEVHILFGGFVGVPGLHTWPSRKRAMGCGDLQHAICIDSGLCWAFLQDPPSLGFSLLGSAGVNRACPCRCMWEASIAGQLGALQPWLDRTVVQSNFLLSIQSMHGAGGSTVPESNLLLHAWTVCLAQHHPYGFSMLNVCMDLSCSC
eukprot:366436-Chlamydomonas_euryale.AAC.15